MSTITLNFFIIIWISVALKVKVFLDDLTPDYIDNEKDLLLVEDMSYKRLIKRETFSKSDKKNVIRIRKQYSNAINMMDRTVDPCNRFYDFSCGNYAEQSYVKLAKHKTNIWNQFVSTKRRIDRVLLKILENNTYHENINIPYNRPLSQARIHYCACLNRESSTDSGPRYILDLLNSYISANIWKNLTIPTIRAAAVHDSVERIHRELNIGVFFEAKVELIKNRTIFRITSSKLISKTSNLFYLVISNKQIYQTYKAYLIMIIEFIGGDIMDIDKIISLEIALIKV
ncbi:unnamed protein product [Gordionus sp. m RMFG-2023]